MAFGAPRPAIRHRESARRVHHDRDRGGRACARDSHALANSVAFDTLQDGADLEDSYIKGNGKALDVVRRQLLTAGIRIAFLLDQNFK
jgi:hypothetical protein